ncbi:hypothetical protein, partial [Ralstonia pseudosolanacearum]|uniref:hypothetical protein n=1 Tax=Ralstonia pseudosolanacearum TaxID=1310165 RepID=UPI001E48A8E2
MTRVKPSKQTTIDSAPESRVQQNEAGQPFRETLINGVREWNREPSCSRFPHRGKEVPIEHVFRRFRVVP